MRISDWSSDVCSSDLSGPWMVAVQRVFGFVFLGLAVWMLSRILPAPLVLGLWGALLIGAAAMLALALGKSAAREGLRALGWTAAALLGVRSEEHTSELQSLMRSSYAVCCLKKKK